MKQNFKHFIIDVDGVLTDGKFYYSSRGKELKAFGAHDHDALQLIKNTISIRMVTGDKRGFAITKRRIHDMGFPLNLVSTFERAAWMKQLDDPHTIIYMGDGIFDSLVFNAVGYGIAPAQGFSDAVKAADYVTKTRAGEGAVAEACFHLMKKFFKPIDVRAAQPAGVGVWRKAKV